MQPDHHATQGVWQIALSDYIDEPATAHATARVTLNAACRVLIVAVWLWALVETYWELTYAPNDADMGIILLSKLFLTGFVFAALVGSSTALLAFAFGCVVSIVVIGVTLPDLFSLWRTLFYLSLAEGVVKMLAAISIALRFVDDHRGEDEREPWRRE